MIEFLIGLVCLGATIAVIAGLSYLMGRIMTRKQRLDNWTITTAIGLLGLVAVAFSIPILGAIYEVGKLILAELL